MMAKRKQPPHPVDIHVGRRIKTRRLMLGLSQTNVSAPLGVTFQQLQKYEKGSNRVSASRMQQIAGLLEVPVSYFFEGAPGHEALPAAADDDLQNLLTDRQVIALLCLFASITDPAARAAVLAVAEAFALPANPKRKAA